MSAPSMVTGSQLVAQELERLGGTAPQADVLTTVSRARGRRDAGCAIKLAVLAGDVAPTVLADGRSGLTLTRQAERGEVAA